jgi:hypothetical protein
MPTRTELIWDGKYDATGKRVAPLRVALPFQTVPRGGEGDRHPGQRHDEDGEGEGKIEPGDGRAGECRAFVKS